MLYHIFDTKESLSDIKILCHFTMQGRPVCILTIERQAEDFIIMHESDRQVYMLCHMQHDLNNHTGREVG